MITNYDGRIIVSFPWFVAPLVALTVVAIVLLGTRPQRRFALLTIVSIGLGFAFVIPFGLYIRLSYVFAVMTLVAWMLTGYRVRVFSDTAVKLGIVFLGYSLFSMVWTFQAPYLEWRVQSGMLHGLPIRTLVQNAQLGLMLAMFVIAFDYCRERSRFRRMLQVLTIVTGFVVLYALYEVATGRIMSIPYVNLMPAPFTFGGYRRAQGGRLGFGAILRPHAFFGEPAWFAGYLLCAVPLLASDIMLTRRGRARLVKILLLIVTLVVYLLAASRAGMVAGAGALFMALIIFRTRFPLVRTAVVAAVVIATAGVFASNLGVMGGGASVSDLRGITRTRASEEGRSSFRRMSQSIADMAGSGFSRETDRYRSWMAALEVFRQKPLVGVGLGNYPFWRKEPGVVEPVNMLLRILCELGIIGLLLFSGYVGCVLWRLRRLFRVKRYDRELFIYSGCVTVAIVATLIQRMSFDGLTNDPIFWIVLGMGAALPRLRVGRAWVAPPARAA